MVFQNLFLNFFYEINPRTHAVVQTINRQLVFTVFNKQRYFVSSFIAIKGQPKGNIASLVMASELNSIKDPQTTDMNLHSE